MTKELLNYRWMLFLKNQLLTIDFAELLEFYSEYDNYVALIETLTFFQEKDIGFFMINTSMVDDVMRLLNIYRFTDKGKPYFDVINGQINTFNELLSNCKDEGVTDTAIYFSIITNQVKREKEYSNIKEFIMDLANDFCVFEELYTNRFYGTSTETFVGSVNYFLRDFPQMFMDENIYNNCLDRFKKIKESSSATKKQKNCVEKVKEKLLKIVEKEA